MPDPKPSASEPLTAKAVVELLGIKPQTLYAYVARGWVRAVSQPGRKTKLYSREDVERLRLRSQSRAGNGATAAAALHWGEPVVATAITEITPDGPRYRGRLASELAQARYPVESAAELLWTGIWQDAPAPWRIAPLPRAFVRSAAALPKGAVPSYTDRLATLMHLLGDACHGEAEAQAGSLLPPARQAMHVAATALAYLRADGAPTFARQPEYLAETAARALGMPGNRELAAALDFTLTLCADHELPPSTFVSRIVASTGSGIHACLAAGISGFYGVLTGAGTDSIEELVVTSRSRPALLRRLQELIERGRDVVGFNHPLYPQGDPRARLLLDYASRLPARPARLRMLLDFAEEAESRFAVRPSLALGLVAIQVAFELPRRTASALNLLARLAGMTAHVQEQRMTCALIRPRARYVGP